MYKVSLRALMTLNQCLDVVLKRLKNQVQNTIGIQIKVANQLIHVLT